MNAEANTNQANSTYSAPKPVVAAEGTPEFLKLVADKLATEGEVLVQTDEALGSNAQPIKPTVH